VPGELAFIERLSRRLPPAPEGETWIGDDAAVLADGQLLKTDVIVQGTHFELDWCSPEDVGWKALAVNLSDIAAMGGTPVAALVSLVVPPGPGGLADRVMDGLASAAEHYACPVVGGDTATGPVLVVAVSVLGTEPAEGAVLRSGARPGDVIMVTGDLGGAAAALAAISAGRYDTPGIDRLRRPIPRLPQGAAVAAGGATAMIDLSDGLATDLDHLCARSGCGAVLDEGAIPCAQGADIDTALLGGDDYELLFTVPPHRVDIFTEWSDPPATSIGVMVDDAPHITVRGPEGERPLLRRAWEHEIPGPDDSRHEAGAGPHERDARGVAEQVPKPVLRTGDS
jgi:thiamine-monophosphate kinase